MSGPAYEAGAYRFDDVTTDPEGRGITGTYWLGGVWTADGHLVWSSEPESFDTEAAALAAAQYRIDNDHLGWPLAGRVVPVTSAHLSDRP